MPAFRSDRSPGQAVLIILLGVAFAAILLARLTGGGAPAALDSATATPGTSADASAVATNSSSSRPSGAADPSSGSSSSPAAGSDAPGSAQPSAGTRTYKIKAGDTLIGIAAKFNTTPKAIAKLNGLTNPSALKVGQILQIP